MLIEITRMCNENCSHCMVNATLDGPHMSVSTFIKCIQFTIDNKIAAINISGGDPFLHPQFFKLMSQLLKQIKGKRHGVMIESNGWWIEDESMCNRIKNLLDNGQVVGMQISTNKKFYPNYEWTMSHESDFKKLHEKVKFIANWQGVDTNLHYMGRAKNIMSEDEVKGYPPCMNYVSYALQRHKLGITHGNELAQLLEYGLHRMKTCVPYIQYDGTIKLGEGIECMPISNINQYFDKTKFTNDLMLKITKFIPCNSCKTCKNVKLSEWEIFDECRTHFGLQPVFVKKFYSK